MKDCRRQSDWFELSQAMTVVIGVLEELRHEKYLLVEVESVKTAERAWNTWV